MNSSSPDGLALLYVQQYLSEHGYTKALQALEGECGLIYDDLKLDRSAQLLQLVYKHIEKMALEDQPEEGSAEAADVAEEEAMLRGGRTDSLPLTPTYSIVGAHPSSVVCVRIVPGCDEVLTGSGDGRCRRVSFTGQVTWEAIVGSGGVLCLDMHPSAYCILSTCCTPVANGSPHHPHSAQIASPSGAEPLHAAHLVAAGSMDGSLTLVHLNTGQVLVNRKVHAKYLVRTCWAGDGHTLVTCSHDQTVQLHRVEVQPWPEGGLTSPRGGEPVTVTTVRTIQYATSVQDLTFLADGTSLVVALRDTNYLRVLTLDDLTAPETLVNLNANGDDHVSFFARHLVPSPCGRFLLVSADTGRMLVLRTRTWRLVPRFALFSLPTEQFHQFCAAWSGDSHYVFAGAAGGQVRVYHVGSGKVVAVLPVHKVNVRDLDIDHDRHLLATCSFDRTVQILTRGGAQAGGAASAGLAPPRSPVTAH